MKNAHFTGVSKTAILGKNGTSLDITAKNNRTLHVRLR